MVFFLSGFNGKRKLTVDDREEGPGGVLCQGQDMESGRTPDRYSLGWMGDQEEGQEEDRQYWRVAILR